MTKIDRLKVALVKYERTKSIALSKDICDWLYKQLIHNKRIEVKDGRDA